MRLIVYGCHRKLITYIYFILIFLQDLYTLFKRKLWRRYGWSNYIYCLLNEFITGEIILMCFFCLNCQLQWKNLCGRFHWRICTQHKNKNSTLSIMILIAECFLMLTVIKLNDSIALTIAIKNAMLGIIKLIGVLWSSQSLAKWLLATQYDNKYVKLSIMKLIAEFLMFTVIELNDSLPVRMTINCDTQKNDTDCCFFNAYCH